MADLQTNRKSTLATPRATGRRPRQRGSRGPRPAPAEASVARVKLAQDLARAADGDHAAFVRVYEATSAKLFGIVVRILGRTDIAEEVLQETYVKVWQCAATFDPAVASPITWLAIIARNKALDHKRRRVPVSLDSMPGMLELRSTSDLAGEVAARDEARWLEACLSRLEPLERGLIEQSYLSGESVRALAGRLAMPEAVARRTLGIAMAKLKKLLEARNAPASPRREWW